MKTTSQPTGIITIQSSKDAALKTMIWTKGGGSVHNVVVTSIVARIEPFACPGPVRAGADIYTRSAAGGKRVGYGEGKSCKGEG